jgi:hypothetical protein
MKVVIIYAELPHVSEISVNREGVIVTIDKSRVDSGFLAPLMTFEIARGRVQWQKEYPDVPTNPD